MSKRRPKVTIPPISAADGPPPASPQAVTDGFLNLVSALGSSSDKNAYSGYAIPVQMSQLQLDAMYRGSWLAGKIVDAPVADMTREWVALTWDGRDDDDNDSNAIEVAEVALKFRERIRTGMKWARLYGGACSIVVMRGEDLSTPLDVTKIKKGGLLNFITRDRWRFPAVTDVDQDTNSPNFDLPLMYTIAESGQQVHWTRVIRWPGRELPYYQWRQNAMWDDSELFHVVNALQNYDGACAAAGSMLHEANVDIISAKGLAKAFSAGQDSAVIKRFQLSAMNKSLNKNLLLDADTESWQQKVTSFSGIESILVRFMIDVSGAADIPTTRLFGQSPAGLSATGESDIRNYYDRLSGDQEAKLRAPLMRMYEILVRSVLGGLPDGFEMTFNPLWQMSDVEAAARDNTRATMDAAYIAAKVITPGLAARELKDRGTYRTIEDEDIEEAEEASLPDENESTTPGNFDPETGEPVNANQGSEASGASAGTKETPPPAEVTLPKQAAHEAGDAAPTKIPAWFQDCLNTHDSIVITGGPKHGKTTLASLVKDRPTWSTDELLNDETVSWAQTPEQIAARARAIGQRYVIEGVHTAHALRSGKLTADCVVSMNGPKVPLSAGQATMAKGVATVFGQWRAANPGATVVHEPKATGDRAMPGDMFKHDGSGWTVYRDGKRIGGPYATMAKARRRLKMG